MGEKKEKHFEKVRRCGLCSCLAKLKKKSGKKKWIYTVP